MSRPRFLCLGAGDGWHSQQLAQAAVSNHCDLAFASYESLQSTVGSDRNEVRCEVGSLSQFDAVLTRTMPAGSLEQITFRLAVLHQLHAEGRLAIVNPPRSLEIAIDKYATLAHVAALGHDVPATMVVQSRAAAMEAFRDLGEDCVVKPVFGGEGRGVMRVRDAELAWYTFSTLEQLGAVIYVQRFVAPGGRDTRLLVIGDQVFGIRRTNAHDFRTNANRGATAEAVAPTDNQVALAIEICRSLNLKFAAVDLIDTADDRQTVLEVNAIPGWKGAQGVVSTNIAHQIIGLLQREAFRMGVVC